MGWHGVDALVLESPSIRVVVLPGLGARVASLVDRRTGKEWLQQPRSGSLGPAPAAGTRFVDTDHFGWDEMFPTVDPCPFPDEALPGVELCDHGALWAVPWEVLDASAEACTLRVETELPDFSLTRRLALRGAVLRAEYELVSRSDRTLPTLWAAHPQFDAVGARLRIEPSPRSLVDVTAGDVAVEVPYVGGLEVPRDVTSGGDAMLYLPPGEPFERAVLETGDGQSLTWSNDTETCPYLGLWLDRGRHTTGEVVAIEPSTSYYDALDRAVRLGRARHVGPGEAVTWWVEVELGRAR
ncbi:MAG: hypothetical protein M0Z33_08430 [Actinomycetota bacterium]|nr:hypothetical protein [Actinomycetota bacterium]